VATVLQAMAAIPVPKPGKHRRPGRDAVGAIQKPGWRVLEVDLLIKIIARIRIPDFIVVENGERFCKLPLTPFLCQDFAVGSMLH
jgi:hypothetical protein